MLSIRKVCWLYKYGAGRLKKNRNIIVGKSIKIRKRKKKIKNEYDNKKIEESIKKKQMKR